MPCERTAAAGVRTTGLQIALHATRSPITLYDARDDEEERDSRLDITVTPLKLGDKCPYCGGRLLPVVYGEPGPELFEKADRGEVILGGCIVSGLDPEKECAECGFQFLEVDEKELRG